MAEPRSLQGLEKGSGAVGQRLVPGRKGSVPAGGQIRKCSGGLCGNPQDCCKVTKGIFTGRAKISAGAGMTTLFMFWVYCNREITLGSQGICPGRAKGHYGCRNGLWQPKGCHRPRRDL